MQRGRLRGEELCARCERCARWQRLGGIARLPVEVDTWPRGDSVDQRGVLSKRVANENGEAARRTRGRAPGKQQREVRWTNKKVSREQYAVADERGRALGGEHLPALGARARTHRVALIALSIRSTARALPASPSDAHTIALIPRE